jgi:hypothetical protein
MDRAFSPDWPCRNVTQAVGLGWYGGAPLVLFGVCDSMDVRRVRPAASLLFSAGGGDDAIQAQVYDHLPVVVVGVS